MRASESPGLYSFVAEVRQVTMGNGIKFIRAGLRIEVINGTHVLAGRKSSKDRADQDDMINMKGAGH